MNKEKIIEKIIEILNKRNYISEFPNKGGSVLIDHRKENLTDKQKANQIFGLFKRDRKAQKQDLLKQVEEIIETHSFRCSKVATSVNELREKINQLLKQDTSKEKQKCLICKKEVPLEKRIYTHKEGFICRNCWF